MEVEHLSPKRKVLEVFSKFFVLIFYCYINFATIIQIIQQNCHARISLRVNEDGTSLVIKSLSLGPGLCLYALILGEDNSTVLG